MTTLLLLVGLLLMIVGTFLTSDSRGGYPVQTIRPMQGFIGFCVGLVGIGMFGAGFLRAAIWVLAMAFPS